ncbi:lamin tail domain-containing protein [Chryseobacterium wanjuense]
MRKIFTLIGFVSIIAFANAQIVISEIYGGGGNSGSTLKNDYVVLKNIGSATASLTGATLQYAPAAGTFTQYHTLPNITLNPGQTYLIQEATGGGGTVDLPTPDFIATTVVNFDGSPNPSVGIGIAVTSGKIVIANNNVQVTGSTSPNVVDFVGYGSAANQYEGIDRLLLLQLQRLLKEFPGIPIIIQLILQPVLPIRSILREGHW